MKKFFAKVKDVLEGKRGEGNIDTAVKMIIAVVIGALLLAGLYYIFNSMILPGLAERIQDMFGSPGGGGNNGGGGGIILQLHSACCSNIRTFEADTRTDQ